MGAGPVAGSSGFSCGPRGARALLQAVLPCGLGLWRDQLEAIRPLQPGGIILVGEEPAGRRNVQLSKRLLGMVKWGMTGRVAIHQREGRAGATHQHASVSMQGKRCSSARAWGN